MVTLSVTMPNWLLALIAIASILASVLGVANIFLQRKLKRMDIELADKYQAMAQAISHLKGANS